MVIRILIAILIGSLVFEYSSILPISASVAESPHPYPDNYKNEWKIHMPGATEMRIHFAKLEIAQKDRLRLLDKDKNVLAEWTGYPSVWPLYIEDFWTEWYTGDTFILRLETDESHDAYGFLVDEVEIRTSTAPTTSYIAESYHPYAANYENEWKIHMPGATEMRIHFAKLEIAHADYLRLLDKDKNVLAEWTGYSWTWPLYIEDFWTEWYTGDTLILRLETAISNAYGFLVDKVEIKDATGTTTLIVKSPPDLTISLSEPDKYNITQGDTIRVKWIESNIGKENVGPYTVGIYLLAREGKNYPLAKFHRDGLDAGHSISYEERLFISNSIPPGSYYLTAFIDDTFSISETDEGNNASSTRLRLSIIATLPPLITISNTQIDGLRVTINGDARPGYDAAKITMVQWDWGDGNKEDSSFPGIHTYEKEGTYTITVTAHQSDGLTTSSTTTVTLKPVTAPTIGPSPTPSPQPSPEESPQPPTPTFTTPTPPLSSIPTEPIPPWMLIGIIVAAISIPFIIFARRITSKSRERERESKEEVSKQPITPERPITPKPIESVKVPNFPTGLYGKYEPIEFIGEGGYGSVFKVKSKHDEKIIALKVLKSEVSLDTLSREVSAWLQLDHKNIVRLYSVSREPIPHLEVELVEGITINDKRVRDLRTLIELNKPNGIEENRAVEIVRGIAEGLRYAHSKNIYHLDIKPANILITSDHKPKITDWGLAKIGVAAASRGMTVLYAAPEQLDKHEYASKYGYGTKSDHRTDIYQLGLTFYELLTGKLPYDINSLDTIIKIVDPSPYRPVSSHRIELAKYDNIISKMLAKRMEDRYQSIEEFIHALTILEGDIRKIEELRKSIDKNKDIMRTSEDIREIKRLRKENINMAIELAGMYIKVGDIVSLRNILFDINDAVVTSASVKPNLEEAIKQIDYCIRESIAISDDFTNRLLTLLHEVKREVKGSIT